MKSHPERIRTMKFTDTELIWIKVIMEQTYSEYADSRNIELKNKQYEEAELSKRHMDIMENIVDKIRKELGI